MLNCIIIDDEPLAQDVIEEHLRSVNDIILLGKFNNAYDGLDYLSKKKIDLVFLDIEMPEMDGISFLKLLENPPLTVFTTAYRDYAYDGYELGAIDFLLKPISLDRFLASIGKVKEFFRLEARASLIENTSKSSPYIFIKSGVEKIKLYLDTITHIQGLKDYAIIYTLTDKIVTKGSVKAMGEIFDTERFIRVHKSFIVAKKQIYHISKNKILFNDCQIPIGRNFKKNVDELIAMPKNDNRQ